MYENNFSLATARKDHLINGPFKSNFSPPQWCLAKVHKHCGLPACWTNYAVLHHKIHYSVKNKKWVPPYIQSESYELNTIKN